MSTTWGKDVLNVVSCWETVVKNIIFSWLKIGERGNEQNKLMYSNWLLKLGISFVNSLPRDSREICAQTYCNCCRINEWKIIFVLYYLTVFVQIILKYPFTSVSMASGDHLPHCLAARFNSNLSQLHKDPISFVFDSTFLVIYYQLTRTRLTQTSR